MKNHRLIDICRLNQQRSLQRKVRIAAINEPHPGQASAAPSSGTKVFTYVHDGDIDLSSVCSMNMGMEEGELKEFVTLAGAQCIDKSLSGRYPAAKLHFN